MRLLLDSHVALWWATGHQALGARAREEIAEAAQVFVSVVTPWELGIKEAKGRLQGVRELMLDLQEDGVEVLPVLLDATA